VINEKKSAIETKESFFVCLTAACVETYGISKLYCVYSNFTLSREKKTSSEPSSMKMIRKNFRQRHDCEEIFLGFREVYFFGVLLILLIHMQFTILSKIWRRILIRIVKLKIIN
jgi:hypothetical protein